MSIRPTWARRFRDGALTAPTLRLIALLAGLLLLAVGVATAIGAEASTALLIVGAALVLAALVFGDWLEIVLRHSETEAKIRREARVEGATQAMEPIRAALQELAESSEEDVRPRLRQLNENLSEYATTSASQWGDVWLETGSTAIGMFDHPRGDAVSEVRLDRVFVRLTPLGFTPNLLECHIRHESGQEWSSGEKSWLLTKTGPSAELVFPDDFHETVLRPGSYSVRWDAVIPTMSAMTYDAGTGDVRTSAEPRKHYIAAGSFIVPGDRPDESG